MPFSLQQACTPPLIRNLSALAAILTKAQTQAEARKIDPAVLVNSRLAPDMHPFRRQVQIASDTAKGAVARLSQIETPSYEDTEQTFGELQARIAKTVDFISGVDPAAMDGAEDRTVTLKFPQGEMPFLGRDYLTGFVLPNVYFHTATAYLILRHNGIEIGKRDYIGGF